MNSTGWTRSNSLSQFPEEAKFIPQNYWHIYPVDIRCYSHCRSTVREKAPVEICAGCKHYRQPRSQHIQPIPLLPCGICMNACRHISVRYSNRLLTLPDTAARAVTNDVTSDTPHPERHLSSGRQPGSTPGKMSRPDGDLPCIGR